MELLENMEAPDFCLIDYEANQHCLSNMLGNWIVLYFYPKDMTPGCTKEACDFRDNYEFFKKNKILLFGISKDNEDSHKKFVKKYNLPFPLLSDKDGKVSTAYNVMKEKTLYGKKSIGIDRSTFIINPEGKIEKIFRKVKVEGHIEEVRNYFLNNKLLNPQFLK